MRYVYFSPPCLRAAIDAKVMWTRLQIAGFVNGILVGNSIFSPVTTSLPCCIFRVASPTESHSDITVASDHPFRRMHVRPDNKGLIRQHYSIAIMPAYKSSARCVHQSSEINFSCETI